MQIFYIKADDIAHSRNPAPAAGAVEAVPVVAEAAVVAEATASKVTIFFLKLFYIYKGNVKYMHSKNFSNTI